MHQFLMSRGFRALVLCGGLFMSAGAQAQHTDFEIGRDDAGVLQLEGPEEFLDLSQCVLLEPGDGTYADYHVATVPGWEHLEADEPDEGFFRLADGHGVGLRRIGFPLGFGMFDPITGNPILENDNDVYVFPLEGGSMSDFHIDLIYAGGPMAAPGTQYTARFQLVDQSGITNYAASEPFSLCFQVVPEPATCGLLLIGACALLRRR